MSKLQIYQFPCLSDNYGVLVHDPANNLTAAIDAPDATQVLDAVQHTGWALTHILVTHHHYDHTQGIADVKTKTGCQVWGPADEADKIKDLDRQLSDGETFAFGDDTVTVISTPGHTLGMINFHFQNAGIIFTGDTLFALGCGRIFEGNPAMMWDSLTRLIALPAETEIYCGHEYTLANAEFALSVDPDNEKLRARAREIERLRNEDKPTLPTTLALELETNPFLRPDDPAIRKHLQMEQASDAEVFAEIRKRKDNF